MHALILVSAIIGTVKDDPAGIAFFEKKIRPVLIRRCYKCHSAKKSEGSLRLDSRKGIRQGGESGPAVVPNKTAKSLLIAAIKHQSFKMPPDGKLPKQQIADFERWIRMGAPDPRTQAARTKMAEPWDKIVARRRKIWSLQPVKKQTPPPVTNAQWSQPVDRFLYAALRRAKLQPAQTAGKAVLLRRLSFALRGIPPTPAETRRFVADQSPTAYEQLVERLLASPKFGERWARHWMDVVRFSETHGHEWNFEIRGAWRFRDYLIRAFNGDLPYDQLLREHLAGDLLKQPRWNRNLHINESLVATAFYRFGEVGHDNCLEFKEISLDVLDNQIDTMTKAFQAMTVSCARCHDHKLDAVSNRDYYALSGVIASSRTISRTIDDPSINHSKLQELRKLKTQIRQTLGRIWLGQVDKFKRYAEEILDPKFNPAKPAFPEPEFRTWLKLIRAAQKKKPGLDDPLRPLHVALARRAKKSSIGMGWVELLRDYSREHKARGEYNRRFTSLDPRKWHREGLSMQPGDASPPAVVSKAGEFHIPHQGDTIIGPVLPGGLYSHRFSNRLNAGLRSPFLPKDKQYLSVQVVGGQKGAIRKIYDNCHLGLNVTDINSAKPKWITLSTSSGYAESKIYVSLVTKLDNQLYPTYNTGQRVNYSDFRSFVGISAAVLHNEPKGLPKPSIFHMVEFVISNPPQSLAQVLQLYQDAFTDVVSHWIDGTVTDQHLPFLTWLQSNKLLPNSLKGAAPELQGLVARYRKIEATIAPPKIVNAIGDLNNGFNAPLLIRGDPFKRGAPVPRQFVSVLAKGKNQKFRATSGSGRRELADIIASKDNPLTARVMVNRIWHHLFGRGIVATPDDFGAIGERPAHPELLDYLAGRFVSEGWSIKSMVRRIVLTRAYRMSSQVDRVALQVDPQNKLLHHFPLRRLEAEAIRDALLATSGRLDTRMFGPSIHPYRYKERKSRRLFTGPLDGLGRRSIYMKLTLTEEPPFLTVFNLPEAKAARGRRDVTSVPAQALALLNDPFVHNQAERWAKHVVRLGSSNVAERLRGMLQKALSRSVSERELQGFVVTTRKLAQLHQVPKSKCLDSEAVWKDVAHIIFNLKEFIYVP